MTDRIPLIAGNWKMNMLRKDAVNLARGIAAGVADGCQMLVCPPAVLIPPVVEALSGAAIAVGGQDCHFESSGAHTGDIAAAMLADAGCSHVIVGHSERRADHGETDMMVCAKAQAAHGAGLVAIVCVGETLDERDAGRTLEVVGEQVSASLPAGANPENTVIAYEPVWAIGTGRTPTLDDVAQVHTHIRSQITDTYGAKMGAGVRILYGGSMKPSNAEELLAIDGVDGGLIGGASLKVEDFLGIAGSCP